MTYQECVDYILSVPLFAAKLGTDTLNQILDIMEHPEKSYAVVHVAGTNGKGSTCSFLASILKQAEKKVGVFTSPHLIKINERLSINGQVISDEEFVILFTETMGYIEIAKKQGIPHPSFFELMFLMGALYFKKQQVDYAIFETGMGGRLDATNVLEPILTIITSVGLDHTQFLGDTIEKIAAEKAGIIKKGVPVVFFDRKDEATPIICHYCKKNDAHLHIVEKKQYNLLEITEKTIDFSFDSVYYMYGSLKIRKTALYQIENAVLAVKAYELLLMNENRFYDLSALEEQSSNHILTDTDIDDIQAGLMNMLWRGRMECVSKNVYIDGAHNEEAIDAFCRTIEVLFPNEQKILLFAVSRDKDYGNMIKKLCEIDFHEVIVVRYDDSRSAEVSMVAETFRHFSGSKITTFDDIREGFLYGKSHVCDSVLFCVGSLYLAGNLLSLGV
ncbi:MAG: bifunctional folylpolyglutamate synthase/dihydrofolate synthase [Lachnospiraceae bacterium]|nr:bifunctional folylpolyglutamate synthase/dihydrofolate synthase [Lachnospiraceae bacterium]